MLYCAFPAHGEDGAPSIFVRSPVAASVDERSRLSEPFISSFGGRGPGAADSFPEWLAFCGCGELPECLCHARGKPGDGADRDLQRISRRRRECYEAGEGAGRGPGHFL